MADNVKWFKFMNNMFDDEKIEYIESLPDGQTILMVWIKTLCLASKSNSNGQLMLTEEIPYTSSLLAYKFKIKESNVEYAYSIMENLGMITIKKDVLSVSNWSKYQSVDELARLKEQNRLRVAKCREKKKLIETKQECNVTGNVTETLKCNENALISYSYSKNNSKKESKYINKCVRESYDDIIGNSELGEKVQDALREFIQHCCLNKNAPTNSKLKGIIQALKEQYKTDDEMVNSLNKAVNGGYFDIKRETAETTTTAEKVDVDEVLRKRKLHAETVAQRNLDTALVSNYKFKALYQELNAIEKDLAMAELSGDMDKLARLEYKKDSYYQQGKRYLEEMDLTWSDLTPHYHCEKCKDTGWIGTKECTCRKELRG